MFIIKISIKKVLFIITIISVVLYSEVPIGKPTIINRIPHSTSSFTQGLLFANNNLYESCGAPEGRISTLNILNSKNGSLIKSKYVKGVFAEGVVLIDSMLVQLTWKSGKAFKYTKNNLQKISEYKYDGEGWGITTDGSIYIISDGSDTLFFRDDNFRIIGKVAVTNDGKPLYKINELEFAKGRVFANVWYDNFIYEINLSTGKVTKIIDCRDIIKICKLKSPHSVLNGIAYDSEKDEFYITGKDWPTIFKVKF